MHEQDLKMCYLTKLIPVIDEESQVAQLYLRQQNASRFAEVTGTYRLNDLLHRDEYRPVAAVRFFRSGCCFVRVYFEQLHQTQLDETSQQSEKPSQRGDRIAMINARGPDTPETQSSECR